MVPSPSALLDSTRNIIPRSSSFFVHLPDAIWDWHRHGYICGGVSLILDCRLMGPFYLVLLHHFYSIWSYGWTRFIFYGTSGFLAIQIFTAFNLNKRYFVFLALVNHLAIVKQQFNKGRLILNTPFYCLTSGTWTWSPNILHHYSCQYNLKLTKKGTCWGYYI